jgi:hypothetical protein
MTLPTRTLRQSLGASADIARFWFESRTTPKTKATFGAKGRLGDSGIGAVYAYYSGEAVLYVGQTGRSVKARLHDQTSPHKSKPWWPFWTHIRFVQLADEADRLILEFLLILACAPAHNKKPRSKALVDLLPS